MRDEAYLKSRAASFGKSSKAHNLVVYFPPTLLYRVGMSSQRTAEATAPLARAAAPFAQVADHDLVKRAAIAAVRLRTIPSSTGADSSSVIHNLWNMPYRVCENVLRMPTRRPTREPFPPCPVAVLKDQEA